MPPNIKVSNTAGFITRNGGAINPTSVRALQKATESRK